MRDNGPLTKNNFFLAISFFLLTSTAFANEKTIKTFDDVPQSHWAYEAIHELRSLHITDGMGNNHFGLGQTIKRSEFVAFLVKLMQWEIITPEQGSFADNKDRSRWYYGPIETALHHGVILKDQDRFRPEEPITREEMAIMIVRTLGYNSLANQITYLGSPFDDISQNIGYITIARDFGIITGVGNNLFKPYDTARREEAALMMMRMYNKLNKPLPELHAFYAIRSAHQASMIPDLTSVGFGWSRLEYDPEKGQVILNTTRKNNNEFAIPIGFPQPLNRAKENQVATKLMVFASNHSRVEKANQSNEPLLEYILTRPEVRQQVIQSIVSQLHSTAEGIPLAFDGVVIDFEDMKGDQLKESFNRFLKELKEELDQSDASLYVAVHPARRAGQAYYDGYDFKSIGQIADRVILMAHDYYAKQLTNIEMQSGYTLTPVTPIDEVYYAIKAITDQDKGIEDRSKIYLQLSFDAVQWKLQDGKIINRVPYSPSYEAIQQRLSMDGVTMNYSDRYQNPYATFFDPRDNSYNIIWYEDSRSIEAKIKLAKMFDLQGLSLWRLGNVPDYQEEGTKKLYLDVWQHLLRHTK
ncbi:glycosyl hydrolase family 18 protein [Heliorestis convoluta]|uniref:Uncharacterized protein n=1 Tax=Heliorestis convoluta TaxID=356322 RepID=A0A5Q2N0V5_9FIRM|nr:glycosyl hydrolase family 18 protein [Heliorestis convoluta]QGG48974.1 hypothetical protein FTV88_2885 [Heliorestis convoluta]